MNLHDYANCDAIELSQRIRRGEISIHDTLEITYTLIKLLNEKLNAFVSGEKEQAYLQIEEVDKTSPLAGVPIAIKDCVGLVSGTTRHFGSRLARGMQIDYDSEVIGRYKLAGMIPAGTTNVPEFSSSITTESLLHGPCHNPWDLSRSSGGSGGGGGAAVAAGIVPIAYGNDGAGSIRIPASCNGVFGLRPSRGRIPTGPVDGEFWYGLMVHHVITRSVRDSALVLDISEGPDPGAPYCAPAKQRPFIEEARIPPGKLKIAVCDGSRRGFDLHQDCKRALNDTIKLLTELGHIVIDDVFDFDLSELHENVTGMLAVSLALELPEIAKQTGRPINDDTVEKCHLALYERGKRTSATELSKMLQYRTELGRLLGHFLTDCDVILSPALAEPPIPLGTLNANSDDLDSYLEGLWRYCPFTPLANVTGVPSMSVPLHWSGINLPIGMMFTGPYGDEATLLRLAGQLEQARPWHNKHPATSAWYL